MSEPALSTRDIQRMISDVRSGHLEVTQQLRVRRALINRNHIGVGEAALGTIIPPPFHKSTLAIKTMIGEPMEAAQHYVSRISGNRPDFKVVPLSTKSELTVTVDKRAGEQERLDAQLWEEAEGGEAQEAGAWGMVVGGATYLHVLPRDASFGLPDRIYLEDSDETALMVKAGKLSPSKRVTLQGKVMYAEAGDVWAARRKQQSKERAVYGPSLFTVKSYPRDMVLRERDADGIKWAAICEEVSGNLLAPGTDLVKAAEQRDGQPYPFGLIKDSKGAIIGGISVGSPPDNGRGGNFTLVKFFTREEQVILVSSSGSLEGSKEIYRGKHGCTVQGIPTCPVIEVPFMRTDTESVGNEFATPLSQVMAYVPLINQIETLRSNATAYNLLPRWVVELKDGTILRGTDGEPVVLDNEPTPGLDPSLAAAYPGTLKQLTIDAASSDELLAIYLEQLAAAMPSKAAQGEGGTSEAAWHAHQMIKQSQQILQQPVNNWARGVKACVQMMHGWLRQLDVPVYFYPAPGHRSTPREVRGLIEFDPKDLTDSLRVSQELDTPEDAVVRIQVGMDQHAAGYIDDEEYYSDWAKVQDPREARKRKYRQMVVNHVMGGIPAPPGSVIFTVAEGVSGRLNYLLLQQSPNYAIASAEAMVAQQMMAQQAQLGAAPAAGPTPAGGQPPQGEAPAVAANQGVRAPGIGMNPTLQGQLGSRVPGSV